MPRWFKRLISWRSAAESLGSSSTVGEVATEKTSAGASAGGLPVVRSGSEAEFRGYWMGDTASAPNWASRKRNRRARRVEGSGVRWGFGCLKRWVRGSCFGGVAWEWEC
jgi:hypothetical protein